MKKVKVGVIGCGNISPIYLTNCRKFKILEVAACADILPERARAKAAEFGVPKACSVDELLGDKEINIVLNLTIPKAHADIALKALEAGKSVYNEKPLAIKLEDGQKILRLTKKNGLLVGGAPDTFMGGAHQTCRKLIDEGAIGKPVGATAFMLCHGHEGWHPDPEFYYKDGGGPMFDMGPYYLTALINAIGPVSRVAGSTRVTFRERTITSEPKKGWKIKVDVPTHIQAMLDFENHAIGMVITSFDVWASGLPHIEIYGTEGSLIVPDPNCFGGAVRIWRKKTKIWEDAKITHGYTDNSRGIGVADMACALLSGRQFRANGEIAYHVLEIMHAIHKSSASGKYVTLKSTCKQPEPLPVGLPKYALDK